MWEMNVLWCLLSSYAFFEIFPKLCIFGKKDIQDVIRAAKQDSWICKKAEKKEWEAKFLYFWDLMTKGGIGM